MRSSYLFKISALKNILLLSLFSTAAWSEDTKKTSGSGVEVIMKGPTSCRMDETMDITVELKTSTGGGGDAGFTYEVTLYEKDRFTRDDKLGTETVVGPKKAGAFTKEVKFNFKPSKFEIGKTLELYFIVERKIAGIKSPRKVSNKKDPLKVKCKK